MCRFSVALALAAYFFACTVKALAPARECEVSAQVEAGRVCGRVLETRGKRYASFRGLPYAKQPLGELRFKELQPAEPWDVFYALEDGPVCPQNDVFYDRLVWQPMVMNEACIHANVHVPKEALPSPSCSQGRPPRALQPPFPPRLLHPTHSDKDKVQEDKDAVDRSKKKTGLPILVFIHGGGWSFGSGDEDMHGPEHLVSQGVIVITFNYRLHLFGFLSLNSSSIPGNNGLRDMITLLQWVKRNARAFGGDPDDVTLMGQSAGACSAHLLSLSPAAEGLFKRAILMSGTAVPMFYTTSPAYAHFVANLFITALGINSTDPEDIHRQLVAMPLENILKVNGLLQDQLGIIIFYPVIESPLPGVTTILDHETQALLAKGRGKNIPLLVGYVNEECETFRPRFEKLNMLDRIQSNPLLVLSATVTFTFPPDVALERAKKVQKRFFDGKPTMEQYLNLCKETYFKYPALKVAQHRQDTGGAPTFLYRFSYDPEYSVLREAMRQNYSGSGHVEDLTFVFNVTSVPVPHSDRDTEMREFMTNVVTNFMRCSHPTCHEEGWRPVEKDQIWFRDIQSPNSLTSTELTSSQRDTLQFFDSIMTT